jgi:hypothetical protein
MLSGAFYVAAPFMGKIFAVAMSFLKAILVFIIAQYATTRPYIGGSSPVQYVLL